MKPWRVLETRVLHEGKPHRLRLDRCLTGRGVEVADYFVREVADIALVFALTADDQVVLVRQYRHGAGRLSLELPQGLFEPGEAPLQAGARELLEETGYAAELEPLAELLAHPAIQPSVVHVLLGRGARRVQPPAPEEDEDLEVLLRPRAQVRRLIRSGELQAASSVAAALLALAALET
jgi:8-oxo-dGTP pyrophosphatase MutT (NUDIX family)